MTEVYFGNLPKDIRPHEVEGFFKGYGRILKVEVKDNKGIAFVTIEDRRDAEDAVKDLDGRRFCQSRVTVDLSKGKPQHHGETDGRSYRDSRGFGGDRGRDDRDRGYGGGRDRFDDRRGGDRGFDDRRGGFGDRRGGGFDDRRGGFDNRDRRGGFGDRSFGGRGADRGGYAANRNYTPAGGKRDKKTKFSVLVKNLSTRVQWYDLKDLARKYGNVAFADANKLREGEGIICFEQKEDCVDCYNKMQGEELFGKDIEVEYEFPDLFEGGADRNSRSRSGGRDRSRSPMARRSRSKSNDSYDRRSRSR